jgi:hypothetical protein
LSTGLNCEFIEPTPNTWFYILQNWDCPTCCWDWRDYATAYGPFVSWEQANDHLHAHHPNPGGYAIISADVFIADKLYTQLIKHTRKPL